MTTLADNTTPATPPNGGSTGAMVLCLSQDHHWLWTRRLADVTSPVWAELAEGGIRALVRRVHAAGPRVVVHELDRPLVRSERLIRSVRGMAPQAVVIAVASNHGPETELAARRAGATVYALWPEDAQQVIGELGEPPSSGTIPREHEPLCADRARRAGHAINILGRALAALWPPARRAATG
ncbi:MAG: hypothetical protein ACIAS6_07990 [Phycisphaerales bacterium JB060]